MSELTIITNHTPRYVIEAHELTEKERKEFDYIDWEKIATGESSAHFFRYKGQVYDLDEISSVREIQAHDDFHGWDGYQSDSFFSGILIKWVPDCNYEWIIVGRYYS